MLALSLINLAILIYLFATYLLLRRNKQGKACGPALWVGAVALIMHLGHIFLSVDSGHVFDYSLSSMVVVVSGILVAIYLTGCSYMEIGRLGMIVFPLTAISLGFSQIWPEQASTDESTALLPLSIFSGHVLISILAYCLLTIAAAQAILYAYQEHQFKNKKTTAILHNLPPLQTMEDLLFRLIALGFILLSLTLLTGALFSKEIFGQSFAFNHHTVLAILGWMTFAILLLQRSRSGLRGIAAATWTIAGFCLIQLAYFGTKFVSESLHL